MAITREQTARADKLAWFLADFRRFCALLEINDKSGARVPFRLNETQRIYCSALTARDVVLKPRQVGFTTLALALDVFRFLTIRGSRVVVVCQSMTGNAPLTAISATIRRFFGCLKRVGIAIEFASDNKYEWAIKGRDSTLRIIVAGASEASAAKVGRSGTITHLHLTETAFWEYATDTLNALLECVPGAQHGSMIVSECTPNGAYGAFYQQCKAAESGESGYRLHFFPWFTAKEYSVPLDPGEKILPATEREALFVSLGVTPGQLKWYRRKVAENGQGRTDQEYPSDPETCFLVTGRGFFDLQVTADLLEHAAPPIERRDRDRVALWAKPDPKRKYLLSADTSEGGCGDPSGALMYDRESGDHVATISGQYQPYELAAACAALGAEFNRAQIAVERNNHGHAVLQSLEREQKYRAIYVHEDDKPGWPTNVATRPAMLDALEDAHRRGLWKTRDRSVLTQFRNFVISSTGKAEAAPGTNDDLVMAAAIGWAVRQIPNKLSARGPISDEIAAAIF